jgi:hypothetical protein
MYICKRTYRGGYLLKLDEKNHIIVSVVGDNTGKG